MSEGTEAGRILRAVAIIVDGPRNKTHGDKERSFQGIAKAWARIFGWDVRPSDVARAMVALKEQRMRHGEMNPLVLREHVEDILGYWAIFYELRALEGEPQPEVAPAPGSRLPKNHLEEVWPLGSLYFGDEPPDVGTWGRLPGRWIRTK